MKTVIQVTFDWDDDADECMICPEELENAIHSCMFECVEETCSITTEVKREI